MAVKKTGLESSGLFTPSRGDSVRSDHGAAAAVNKLGATISMSSCRAPIESSLHNQMNISYSPKKFFGKLLENPEKFTRQEIEYIYTIMEEIPISSKVTLFDLLKIYLVFYMKNLKKLEGEQRGEILASTLWLPLLFKRLKEIEPADNAQGIKEKLSNLLFLFSILNTLVLPLDSHVQAGKSGLFTASGKVVSSFISTAQKILDERNGKKVFFETMMHDFPGHQVLEVDDVKIKQEKFAYFLAVFVLLNSSEPLFQTLLDDFELMPEFNGSEDHFLLHEQFLKKIDANLNEITANIEATKKEMLGLLLKIRDEKDPSKKQEIQSQIEFLKTNLGKSSRLVDQFENIRCVYEDSILTKLNPETRTRFELLERAHKAMAYLEEQSRKLTSSQDATKDGFRSLKKAICKDLMKVTHLLEGTKLFSEIEQTSFFHMRPSLIALREITNSIISVHVPDVIKILEEKTACISQDTFMKDFGFLPVLYIIQDDLTQLLEPAPQKSEEEILAPFVNLLDSYFYSDSEVLLEQERPSSAESSEGREDLVPSPTLVLSDEGLPRSLQGSPASSESCASSSEGVASLSEEELQAPGDRSSPEDFFNPAGSSEKGNPTSSFKSLDQSRVSKKMERTKAPEGQKGKQQRHETAEAKEKRLAAVELQRIKKGSHRQLTNYLSKHGWTKYRNGKGSHAVQKHENGALLVVPRHQRSFAPGTIGSIVKTVLGVSGTK